MGAGRVSAVDLVIGFYLALHAVNGWRRGFAATLFGLVSIVLSAAGALILCRPAAVVLDGFTGVVGSVSGHIQRVLGPAVERAGSLEGVLEAMSLGAALGDSVSTGARAAADALARLLVTAACFIALLIVLRIILGVLASVASSPFEEGPAAAANRLVGGAFGCVIGATHVAVAWLAATILATFGVIQPGWLESSFLLRLVGSLAARAVPFVLGKGT